VKKTVRLKPRPLSADAFRPFGDVVEIKNKAPKLINENHTRRYHDLAAIDTAQNNGKPLLSIFRARRRRTATSFIFRRSGKFFWKGEGGRRLSRSPRLLLVL